MPTELTNPPKDAPTGPPTDSPRPAPVGASAGSSAGSSASRRSALAAHALLAALVAVVAAPSAVAAAEPTFHAAVPVVDETRADADYAAARALVGAGRHREALAALRRVQALHPTYSKLSAVQTRIAVLHESADAGDSLEVFLAALDARDAGRLDEALVALDWIAARPARSGGTGGAAGALLDDALYLGAYLSLMDGYDFAEAGARLDELAARAPDSAYADSAEYLGAIVREQLGDTAGARARLVALRERHTALALPFGFSWPTGTLLSRYWFDRADRRIGLIDERLASASRLERRSRGGGDALSVDVNVDGIDMRLALVPSSLVEGTAWRDARLTDVAPPDVGVYEGTVEGVPDSWVRATIQGGDITGMIHVDGRLRRLVPGDLTGTLDYYQPPSRRGTSPALDGLADFDPAAPGLAARLQAIDLLAPPPRPATGTRRSRGALAATRVVPLSIVVDSRFDGYHAGRGLERALDYLNVADGVYREHGLSLALDEAIAFGDEADPLKLPTGTLESFLRAFRDYRRAHDTLFGDSAATYLFTGNRKTDPTLGLAWIDTLCRSDGYDVGVTTPSSFGDVLLTHELGHSFGAEHDSDTACRTDRDGLMWPHISAATGTRLTSCSRDSVRASQRRACLGNGVDLTLDATLAGNDAVFAVTNADPALTVDARLTVETGLPGQVDWPAGCRAVAPTGGECTLGGIGPRERRELHLPLRVEAGGDGEPVGGRVVPLGAAELAPLDNGASVAGLRLAGLAQASGGAAGADGASGGAPGDAVDHSADDAVDDAVDARPLGRAMRPRSPRAAARSAARRSGCSRARRRSRSAPAADARRHSSLRRRYSRVAVAGPLAQGDGHPAGRGVLVRRRAGARHLQHHFAAGRERRHREQQRGGVDHGAAVDRAHHVAPGEAAERGGAAGQDVGDHRAGQPRAHEVGEHGDVVRADAEPAAHDAPLGHDLRYHLRQQLGRDGEADALRSALALQHRGGDAHEPAERVDQRAAGAARIDGRVDLHEVLPGAAALDAAPRGADDALRDRLTDAERIADRQHHVADVQRRRLVERHGGQGARTDAQHGDIGLGVAAHERAGVQRAVGELHADALGAVDEVQVGQHDAVRADDDARALAGVRAAGVDAHDRRSGAHDAVVIRQRRRARRRRGSGEARRHDPGRSGRGACRRIRRGGCRRAGRRDDARVGRRPGPGGVPVASVDEIPAAGAREQARERAGEQERGRLHGAGSACSTGIGRWYPTTPAGRDGGAFAC